MISYNNITFHSLHIFLYHMPVIIKISGNSISITTEEVISGPNRAVKQGVLQEKSYYIHQFLKTRYWT